MDLDDSEYIATLKLHKCITPEGIQKYFWYLLNTGRNLKNMEVFMAKFEVAEVLPAIVDAKDVQLPKRGTIYSAGYDLVSPVEMVIPAHERALVPTGVTCKMAPYEYLQIVPRSGLALKKGITVLNTPGTVDSDYYPNSIGVILLNTSNEPFEIKKGDRIAQAILHTYSLMDGDVPNDTVREGGFGSTGRGV